MIGMIMALVSGILMSVQGVFNTEVTKQSSIWVAAGLVQLSAFFVCVIAWFASGQPSPAELLHVKPAYFLTGGILGAFITMTVIRGIDSLGPARAAMLIVTAQIFAAYLIEVFGLFGVEKTEFSWRKLLGAAVTMIGIIIFKW